MTTELLTYKTFQNILNFNIYLDNLNNYIQKKIGQMLQYCTFSTKVINLIYDFMWSVLIGLLWIKKDLYCLKNCWLSNFNNNYHKLILSHPNKPNINVPSIAENKNI